MMLQAMNIPTQTKVTVWNSGVLPSGQEIQTCAFSIHAKMVASVLITESKRCVSAPKDTRDPPDLCRPNPCKNGGTCFSSTKAFFCVCSAVFNGRYCEMMEPYSVANQVAVQAVPSKPLVVKPAAQKPAGTVVLQPTSPIQNPVQPLQVVSGTKIQPAVLQSPVQSIAGPLVVNPTTGPDGDISAILKSLQEQINALHKRKKGKIDE